MNMSNEEYQKYVMAMAKSSPTAKNLVWAFCVGGGICALGQGLSTLYERWGAGENALPLVSLTLVFVAALLTGLGVFDDIARKAGAGTLVPITGFSDTLDVCLMRSKSYTLNAREKKFVQFCKKRFQTAHEI